MEPLGVKDNLIGKVRNVLKALKVIFKGDGSLDGLLSMLVKKFKVLRTAQVSGYQMEPFWSQSQPHRRRQDHPKGCNGDASYDLVFDSKWLYLIP